MRLFNAPWLGVMSDSRLNPIRHIVGWYIRGTNSPASIGGFVSHGCIRMYNEDITDLFGRVRNGTEVVVTR